MEKSFFFNSVDGDRKYLAEDFASYFSALLKNGVFLHETNALKVLPYSGRQVAIQVGNAFINGYAYSNTTVLYKTLDAAAANRIDRIALRLDMTERNITLIVKKGTSATSPVAPALIRTADIWELGLADVNMAAGITTITASHITDLRENSTYCGGVTMAVDRDEILGDITKGFAQFTPATSRNNIATNETMDVVFGKIAKYLADIKALAFLASVPTANIDAAAVTTAKLADGNVTSAKLADSSVTDAKVAEGISQSKINGLIAALNACATDAEVAAAIRSSSLARQQYIDYSILNKNITVSSSSGTGASITLLEGKTAADIIGIGFRLVIDGNNYFLQGFKNSYDFCNFYLTGYSHFYLSGNDTTHWVAGEFSISNTSSNNATFYCRDLVIHKVSPEGGTITRPSSCNIYYLQVFYR